MAEKNVWDECAPCNFENTGLKQEFDSLCKRTYDEGGQFQKQSI